MTLKSNLEVPAKGPADYVHSAVKTAIASAPGWWAAPAAEIFSMVIAAPLEKRRDEFLEDLVWVVQEIATKVENFQPEQLAQNESFVSATLQAGRIAMATHLQEKRQYLRNALLNVALGNTAGEIKQQIFWNAIEAFTPAHVRTLNLIWRSLAPDWDRARIPLAQRTYGAAIGFVAPEVEGQPALIEAILGELRNRGLTTLVKADILFPQGGLNTNLTAEFLKFVLSPEDLP